MATEFPRQIELTKGMRPEPRDRMTTSGFQEALIGLRPSKEGLYAHQEITPVQVKADWPFPQLIRSESGVFLLLRDQVHDLDQSTGTSKPIGMPAVAGNDLWHMASFQDLWMMTNGQSVIYRLANQDNIKTSPAGVFIKTLGRFGNKVFMGGVSGSYFLQSDWDGLLAVWKDVADEDMTIYDDQKLGTNWLIYGSEAGGGIKEPFLDILYALGLVDPVLTEKAMTLLVAHIEKNHLGFLPLGSPGAILSISQLRDQLIVYTADRVYSIADAARPRAIEIHPTGLLNRNSTALSRKEHLFIDTDKLLWSITDGEPQRLGYTEHIAALKSDRVTGFYDPVEKDAYFGDGERSYVSSTRGFSVAANPVSFAIRVSGGGLMGGVKGTSTEVLLTSNIEDMNSQGAKTVSFVEFQSTGISDLRMKVEFRYGQSEEFHSVNDIPGSADGKFYCGISANEFKFSFSGQGGLERKMEKLVVRFQYTDSTTIRGPRGSESIARV